MAVSQNGWPVIDSGSSPRLVNHDAVTGKILDGDVEEVFKWIVKEYEQHVETIRKDHSWAYAKRDIRGGTTWSNHASATAEDYNAPKHPIGRDPKLTMTKAQISGCREIVSRSGGRIRWGGDYAGRKDTMHWEINANAAQIKALADEIRKGKNDIGNVNPVGRPKPTPKPGVETTWSGLSTKDTINVQRYLRSVGYYKGAIDGKYQTDTRLAVKAFQNDAIIYGGATFKADGLWQERTQNWMVWVRDVLQPAVDDWEASQDLGKLRGDGNYAKILNAHVKAIQIRNSAKYAKFGGRVADGKAGSITCQLLGIRKDKSA